VAATQTQTLAYVYAVTWAAAGARPLGRGVHDAEVTAVEHGELAALVSAVEPHELRARRRDLLRHADVVRDAFERAPVLPLMFGSVLADVDRVVADLLAPRHDELAGKLRRLEGLAEVTLRASYREDDVLRELLLEQPRLARLRGSVSPVQLGEAVAHALAARRDRDAATVLETLRPLARDFVADEPRTALEVVRAALLVERRKLAAVDRKVDELARAHAPTTVFKYTGPLPPHHFVTLTTSGTR
jgi:gas vesicle protein GvpL/GvpF